MTDEQVKAKLSQHFIELLASRRGFKCSPPSPDHGVDLAITKAIPVQRNGRTRFLDSGKFIEIQLKSTCESQVVRTSDAIKYELEAKTWNDLVFRRVSHSVTPLLLVLLVLPDDPNDWVTITADQLIVRRTAYWFQPTMEDAETENEYSITIKIPLANAVSLSFVDDRFAEAFV